MIDLFRSSWNDFFFGFRRFTKYQIVTRLFLALIILPIYRTFFSFLMRSRGDLVFANIRIQEFLFSLQGFVGTIALIVTVTMIVFIEIGGIVVLSQQVHERSPEASYWKVFSFCLGRARKIGIFGGLLFLFYMAVLLPWLNMGISNSLIRSFQIPPFIIDYARARLWMNLLLKGISLAGLVYSIRWIFSLHLILLKDMRASEAMKRSGKLVTGHWWEMAKELAILFALNGALLLLLILVFLGASALAISMLNEGFAGQAVFLALFESLIALIALAGTWVLVPYVIHRLTVLLNRFETIDPIAGRVKTGGNIKWIDWFFTRKKVILAVLLIFVFLLAGLMEVYTQQLDQIRPVVITAHRGDMTDAPENTVAAIEAAVAKGADYAEVDVQMIRDGSLIIMHDANSLRTTDVDLEVAEATRQEIEALNAAASVGWPTKEPVPFLQDVLEAARGRIRLNLELKASDNQEALAKAVVEAIEAAEMEGEVVITSLNQSVLAEVEALQPNLRTGLIVIFTLGEIEKVPVDFFSIEYSRLNEVRVRKIHEVGKEVHAWTVNSEEEMDLALSLGVDGLITDHVDVAKRLLEEREMLHIGQTQ